MGTLSGALSLLALATQFSRLAAHLSLSSCSSVSLALRGHRATFASRARSLVPAFDNRVRLNLHQHFRRNQPAHLHHARRRAYPAKELAVCSSNFFPLRNVRH